MFYNEAVLKNLVIFTGKHLCWCIFFNKNAGLENSKGLEAVNCFRKEGSNLFERVLITSC